MADVFISYSKQERDVAEALAKFLEAEGYTVWWDASLLTGEDYRAVIDRELDAAKVVIVIWTTTSVASNWVISEAEHAARRGILITVCAPGLDSALIPKPYGTHHTEPVENRAAILAAIRKLGVYQRYAGREGELSPHDMYWAEIKDSTSHEDFEQYVHDFPEGRYAAFARVKASRLRRGEAGRDVSKLSDGAARHLLGSARVEPSSSQAA